MNAGKCDTPGFAMTETPEIRLDKKRSTKLYMPRNNIRLNQTSTTLLQGWRGNCDLQILVYRCDPKNPDSSEIARVTDYVASYSCKGNYSLKEERQHNRDLIMGAEDFTGDKKDVARVCKQVMNKCASKRLISKQEAMVLLADLPLTLCTEGFESVSLSNSKQISLDGEVRQHKKLISQYAERTSSFEGLSLYEYFHKIRNANDDQRRIIPNFVGVNGTPKYPVESEYARHTIIVYKPWRTYPNDLDWIGEFNKFINSDECPTSARMAYERVMHRCFDGTEHYEPTSSQVDHSGNPLSAEALELLELTGLRDTPYTDHDDAVFKSMDFGKSFKWDKLPKVTMCLKWFVTIPDYRNSLT